MNKLKILFVCFIVLILPLKSYATVGPEDLPQDVYLEFGKTITVERGKLFKVLMPGRDYIPNGTINSGIKIINTSTTDGFSYLEGTFANAGIYLIKIGTVEGKLGYFIFNVINIDFITAEKVIL